MAHLEGIKSNNGGEILCDGWSCGQTRSFKNTMTEVRRVSALKVKKGKEDEQADEHKAGSNTDSSKSWGTKKS